MIQELFVRGRGTAVVLAVAFVGVIAASRVAGASLLSATTASLAVYAFGFVTGSLLVEQRQDGAPAAWATIRVAVGLLLSSLAFLLSLRLSLPWFLGPSVLLIVAVMVGRSRAFACPLGRPAWKMSAVVAALLVTVLVAPLLISTYRMAPGPFAPVFYNVDSAYFLEKVHALTTTTVYPPASLSNVGGQMPYHFAVQGMAALISRVSGLAAHHSLFLIVLPLLASSLVAASVAAARSLAPAVPAVVSVPLMLVPVPSFWYAFWDAIGPRLGEAWSLGTLAPLDQMTASYEQWGVTAVVGHNVAAVFLVLTTLAGLASISSRGWRLPVVLVGVAIMVKVSAGVAVIAGFVLAQSYVALATRRMRPLAPAVAAVAVFGATYVTFFALPYVPATFAVEPSPLFQLARLQASEALRGLAGDVGWLVLPVLMVWSRRRDRFGYDSVALLLMSLAPFIVVNMTRSVDMRPNSHGTSDDWLQILLVVPLLLHAFVLNVAGQRWAHLDMVRRSAFVAVLALAILPSVFVSGRYALVLLADPEHGHEFVDNRSIGEALATIPVEGTIIVTNDLRYPAEGFRRDDRQMQIPALFGHQAFAVNYVYEDYLFSQERRTLQQLLSAEHWNDATLDAARTGHWTHLLIRKDFRHPDAIPLDLTFSNENYAVYRFGGG